MTDHPVQRWDTGATPTGPPVEEWGKFSSILSFTGATHRVTTWAERLVQTKEGAAWSGAIWTAATLGMVSLYLLTAAWYLFLAMNVIAALMSFAFAIFIWPLIPFSMMWLMFGLAPFGFRSHRKTQRQDSAMMAEQLRVMQGIQANTARRQDGER